MVVLINNSYYSSLNQQCSTFVRTLLVVVGIELLLEVYERMNQEITSVVFKTICDRLFYWIICTLAELWDTKHEWIRWQNASSIRRKFTLQWTSPRWRNKSDLFIYFKLVWVSKNTSTGATLNLEKIRCARRRNFDTAWVSDHWWPRWKKRTKTIIIIVSKNCGNKWLSICSVTLKHTPS